MSSSRTDVGVTEDPFLLDKFHYPHNATCVKGPEEHRALITLIAVLSGLESVTISKGTSSRVSMRRELDRDWVREQQRAVLRPKKTVSENVIARAWDKVFPNRNPTREISPELKQAISIIEDLLKEVKEKCDTEMLLLWAAEVSEAGSQPRSPTL